MSQWRTNTFGKRVHKRQWRRRANPVYYYKSILDEDNELSLFANMMIPIHTAQPKINGAYPVYYRYKMRNKA